MLNKGQDINQKGAGFDKGSKPRRLNRCWRFFVYCLMGLCLLFPVTVLGGVLWLKAGINNAFLTEKIEAVVQSALGDLASIEHLRFYLLLDESYQLVFEASDIMLNVASSQADVEKIGRIRVAIDLPALLRGNLAIKQISLHDVVATLSSGQGGDFLGYWPQDAHRRVDFAASLEHVFVLLDKMQDFAVTRNVDEFVFDKGQLHFQRQGQTHTLSLDMLRLDKKLDGIGLAATVGWRGAQFSLAGQMVRDGAGRASSLALALDNFPLHLGADEAASPLRADGRLNHGFFRLKGNASLDINAVRAVEADESHASKLPPSFDVRLQMADSQAEIGAYPATSAPLYLHASYQHDSGRIILLPQSLLTFGSLKLPLQGFFAPLTFDALSGLSANDIQGKYHFEVRAEQAQVEPEESPEQALVFSARLNGYVAPAQQVLSLDGLTLTTQNGAFITGQGDVRFGAGSPGLGLSLQTSHIKISEAKQLWPLAIAPDARRWVLSHIMGGAMRDVRLDVNLPAGFYQNGRSAYPLTEKEVSITAVLDGFKTYLAGDLPPLQNVTATLVLRGLKTTIQAETAQINIKDERLDLYEGAVVITRRQGQTALLESDFTLSGAVPPVAELVSLHPINAHKKLSFSAQDMGGTLTARVDLSFPLIKGLSASDIDWHIATDFSDFSAPSPLDQTIEVARAAGHAHIDSQSFDVTMKALLNTIPADISLSGKTAASASLETEKITLFVDDALRDRLMPALKTFISGPVQIDVGTKRDGVRTLRADLTQTVLHVPWLGWKKEAGIAANVTFSFASVKNPAKEIKINDFLLQGKDIQLAGSMLFAGGALQQLDFSRANLHRGDDMALFLRKSGTNYQINVVGKSFDARSLISGFHSLTSTSENKGVALGLDARIKQVQGFHATDLHEVNIKLKRDLQGSQTMSVDATTSSGGKIEVHFDRQGRETTLKVKGDDSGTLLRFMNYYDKIHGGQLALNLVTDGNGTMGGAMMGSLSLRDFSVVDEPKLARIVLSPTTKGGRNLNDVVKKKINPSQIHFERAFAQITRGENFLILDNAIVSGQTVGVTFQGIVYDAAGDIAMTGTFMPAYGLNRLFGDVPGIGALLGNGRDRGLIGITFKINGKAKEPQITINPISAIAPGIFRQIFEFQQ